MNASNRTASAVHRQITAMASGLFEVGLYKPDAAAGESIMIPRVWDAETILHSLTWLRHQNRTGRNIYIRPRGEHDLSLVDDLTAQAISAMRQAGFNPAVVVETSPENYQAWLKHHERLGKEVSTAAARALAERFGGDRGAADWRHFGRLAGFTNRKAKYFNSATGLYPFVRLIEADGGIYSESEPFLANVKNGLERRRAKQGTLGRHARTANLGSHPIRSIELFRADARYGGDGTRIDLAYAIHALSRGACVAEVEAAICTRDLSHKGSDRRQNQYVERTIRKALASLERER